MARPHKLNSGGERYMNGYPKHRETPACDGTRSEVTKRRVRDWLILPQHAPWEPE